MKLLGKRTLSLVAVVLLSRAALGGCVNGANGARTCCSPTLVGMHCCSYVGDTLIGCHNVTDDETAAWLSADRGGDWLLPEGSVTGETGTDSASPPAADRR